MTDIRYRADDLRIFAERVFGGAGMAAEHAAAVAGVLLEGDLLGKTTHGLRLVPPYLKEVEGGTMTLSGAPRSVADSGGIMVWDGNYLPGPWLVRGLFDALVGRVAEHGVAIGAIGRSHHIGALQSYLMAATERGLMMVLTASDPREESVAPYGAKVPRYSPNPFAVGIPTQKDPILIDLSASTTANGVVMQARKHGRKLPGMWLVGPDGEPTDDPEVRFSEPLGALYPLGGADLGYKGFGLGIFIEALTAGLSGHGRKDKPDGWGCSIYMQLIDPARFGGADSFRREMSFLGEHCRTAPVKDGAPPVRMPGDGAVRRRADQLANGVALADGIAEALVPWAEKYGVPMPDPLS